MKKEGYNLSMSEILNSIRSDIFSDRGNYNYDNYDRESYGTNMTDAKMSLSNNDNEDPDKNTDHVIDDDDSEILELDDTFLESQDEEFAIPAKQNVVNGNQQEDSFNSVKNEKARKLKKSESKNSRSKKFSDLKQPDQQDDMNDEVDNFLKLIEENDSNLTFQENDKGSQNSNQELNDTKSRTDTDILTALNKADELIQQKFNGNSIPGSSKDAQLSRDSDPQSTINEKLSNIDEKFSSNDAADNKKRNEYGASIMSESAKKASIRSIHKIIETQKKIQNEKRQTIDDLAMAALIPMLQDWMDKNLAKIVEKIVEREISRLINTDEDLR